MFRKKQLILQRKSQSGCSTVGSAPRSGRGGRKFESSHPDFKRDTWVSLFFFCPFRLHRLRLPLPCNKPVVGAIWRATLPVSLLCVVSTLSQRFSALRGKLPFLSGICATCCGLSRIFPLLLPYNTSHAALSRFFSGAFISLYGNNVALLYVWLCGKIINMW